MKIKFKSRKQDHSIQKAPKQVVKWPSNDQLAQMDQKHHSNNRSTHLSIFLFVFNLLSVNSIPNFTIRQRLCNTEKPRKSFQTSYRRCNCYTKTSLLHCWRSFSVEDVWYWGRTLLLGISAQHCPLYIKFSWLKLLKAPRNPVNLYIERVGKRKKCGKFYCSLLLPAWVDIVH